MSMLLVWYSFEEASSNTKRLSSFVCHNCVALFEVILAGGGRGVGARANDAVSSRI
ncbi:hypothetical protein M758_6G093000 [Ceratodon purpureus]|nr:hypothetical protein M758_6G093000 [Ceratodon purpureus]